ncbi:MAG: DegT/DnrJ/EryC1/StrS family aminotransferase [Acetobacteraceae bacterium]|nr:DegT/DnrJ/EryC1/StrS family aminotransferase [Acetobacteraceae bacterium]
MSATSNEVAATAAILPFRARSERRILLSPPHLTGGEYASVEETLRSGWVAPAGPAPQAFEAALADITGFPHVLAVASATAALHLAYRLLNLEPGDEVWAPSLTFVATVAPAQQMRAALRFFDAELGSWTLDPALVRDELGAAARRGRLPRVVVAADLFGQPADIEALRGACEPWGVPVVSDSACGLGAVQRGQAAGRGARLTAYSFNGNKIVTAGGGGALAADDPALIAQARRLAAQAREPAPHYEHETTGFTYAMSSVLAAVGLPQLAALPERVAARRAVFDRYRDALEGLPGITFMPEPAWARSTRWLTAMLIDSRRFGADREAVRATLAARGIESRPVWKPLHLQPAFRHAPCIGGAVAAQLFEQGLCLPSGSALTPADQDEVCETIRRCCAARRWV